MSRFHTRASASAAADFGFAIDPIPQTAPAGPFEVWTDGSCRPNPGPGAWAAILRTPDGTEKEISGAEMDTTNNRMELRAAIAALEALPSSSRVTLHADSEYVFLGMTQRLQGWIADRWRTAKGKPVLNRDLWERLATAAARHQVEWRWTRGHAGDPMNQRVDRLANAAREKVA